jgi:hypothetical protein
MTLPDIYVSNDTEPSHLFWNKGDGTFIEAGMTAGVATSEMVEIGRDGSHGGDYNCDGFLDIFKTTLRICRISTATQAMDF